MVGRISVSGHTRSDTGSVYVTCMIRKRRLGFPVRDRIRRWAHGTGTGTEGRSPWLATRSVGLSGSPTPVPVPLASRRLSGANAARLGATARKRERTTQMADEYRVAPPEPETCRVVKRIPV